MNINLEESSTDRVSPLLDDIANKLLSDLKSLDDVQKDLLFVLAIILLIENGFLPIHDDCELIDPFQSIDKKQMSRWKLSTGLYEALFMLGGCKSPTVKIVMSPLGATAIFNVVIRDLDFETYSVCLPVSRYVVTPQAASIPMIFRDLKHFAITFKNNIICAVKSRILSYCGYPSASLIGLPDEILFKIMLFLPFGDVINLCKTCNRLKYSLENEGFWHNMCKRDFDVDQIEFKEWKKIYKEKFVKKMQMENRPQRSTCFGTIHDYMDYSDYVSYIDNPMWNQLI